MSDILKIYAVKTNNGYYVSNRPDNDVVYDKSSGLSHLLFDGNKGESSFHSSWLFIEKEPKRIFHMTSQPNINHRYELRDKSLVSEKFPMIMKREDVNVFDTNEYDWFWKKEYSHLSSLYELISDPQPMIEVDVPFEWIVLLEVSEILPPENFSYTVQISSFKSDGFKQITNDNVNHQMLDRIIFPSVVLHNKPCSLSSKQLYDIVRQYIKTNINPKYAEITSDYDFCFTVKKRIPLASPYTSEYFTKRGRKTIKHQNYVTSTLIQCFEMTHASSNYSGYTPISGMTAANENELKEKIDDYLQRLIAMINEPLVQCKHCGGLGVEKENININTSI
jgi:hypothetical protein